MYRYRVCEEHLFVPDSSEQYITYGIGCNENNVFVSDVTMNENKIIQFVQLLNENDLSPIHLMDVIEDFLDELQ